MIKYFCDRCGRELVPKGRDKEIMFVTTRFRYSIPKKWDSEPYEHVLCNKCAGDLCDWLTPPKENAT